MISKIKLSFHRDPLRIRFTKNNKFTQAHIKDLYKFIIGPNRKSHWQNRGPRLFFKIIKQGFIAIIKERCGTQ